MRIAILTSSRADYGIYLPLLKRLKEDSFFELKIIAFGTHLSRLHGYTIEAILQDGFVVSEKLETLILGDSEAAISNAIGNTITKFSSLWQNLKANIDLVFALGDRYEMFAAITAAVPFNIKVAHIHGGETTLGAIDNLFRHSISLMSVIHFTSTEEYSKRVVQIIGKDKHVYTIGALSLENLTNIRFYSTKEFKETYQIDMTIPTILVTFHPETLSPEKNTEYIDIISETLIELSKRFQIVITLPNVDTMNEIIRRSFINISESFSNIICIENLGTRGYFSCMRHSIFLLGNSSSGIIEAASLGKFVINIGNRQKGRVKSKNIFDTNINKMNILKKVKLINNTGYNYTGDNIYFQKDCTSNIVNVLRNIYA